MTQAAAHRKKSTQELYHEGALTVEQFLDKLLNGKEGDRTRRRIEEKHNALFTTGKPKTAK